jgi:hypothetical protein
MGETHFGHAALHPDKLRVDWEIDEIETTRVLYRTKKRFEGDVIGIPSLELSGPCGVPTAAL